MKEAEAEVERVIGMRRMVTSEADDAMEVPPGHMLLRTLPIQMRACSSTQHFSFWGARSRGLCSNNVMQPSHRRAVSEGGRRI